MFKKSLIRTVSMLLKMYLKSLEIFANPSYYIKKASISLKMTKKRIEIFEIASNSLKISLKCHAFLKKKPCIFKKEPRCNCRNGQSTLACASKAGIHILCVGVFL
jgi:hypothetical protein